jgi:hypothetical protein
MLTYFGAFSYLVLSIAAGLPPQCQHTVTMRLDANSWEV